jgi:hypothetical protein
VHDIYHPPPTSATFKKWENDIKMDIQEMGCGETHTGFICPMIGTGGRLL